MEYIKENANPVGVAYVDENIDNFIKAMSNEWDATKEKYSGWKIWKRISFSRVTNFLLSILDDLIAYVDDVVDNGPDKKATVLEAMDRLYDYVVKEAMPIYLKPFAGVIKKYIIHEVISSAIDWIVDKYRSGDWRKKTAVELQAQWGHTGSVLPNV